MKDETKRIMKQLKTYRTNKKDNNSRVDNLLSRHVTSSIPIN